MSKPWDNEPTLKCETDWNKKMKSVPINDARDIERRMRAADRLLTQTRRYLPETGPRKEVDAHLEAARKEDGK